METIFFEIITTIVLGCILKEIECGSFELIKQYYECKHLKMINSSGRYIPDSTIPNNTLEDPFYQNFSKMTFEQGLELIQQIYLETNLCANEFCNCVNPNRIDTNKSLFFHNTINFQHVKTIISELNSKFDSKVRSFEDIYYYINSNAQDLPILANFSILVDYTWLRPGFYETTSKCYLYNTTIYDSCMWSVNVVDRVLATNLNNTQLEKQLVCYLLDISSCPVEQQRFMAIVHWTDYLPQLVWVDKSLREFLDRVIRIASNFKPDFLLSKHMLWVGEQFYVNSFNQNTKNKIKSNEINNNLVLLESSLFSIDGETASHHFSKFSLKFYLDSSVMPQQLIYNIKIDKQQRNTNNGKIIKNGKGENILQMIQNRDDLMEIYDFNSKSQLWLYNQSVFLQSPISVWRMSAGILVDGFLNKNKLTPTSANFITLNVQFEDTSNSSENESSFQIKTVLVISVIIVFAVAAAVIAFRKFQK